MYKTIEHIYPLTIVKMRYKGKIVIFNLDCDNDDTIQVQLSDEPSYDLENWLAEHFSPGTYGFGDTIMEAFVDFQERQGYCGQVYYDTKLSSIAFKPV